jgi:cytochrome c-type biogenesis protein CcmH/NrfF
MSPEKRGFNLFVWLAPVGVLLVGGGLGLATIRKSGMQRAAEASEGSGRADEPSGLDPWIEKIRSEAAED